eukprot:CAMPEP_0197023138 /NCGR_PEP_ID=MMETSP1384-20130603/3927_1 /TAXON_ID=29189 /ORGANISM="Ammonia sp." /LENGTH=490 /DNA_ID=CAMNT_0042451315 /DNA_START=9 /DNA_END=1478 /DNA_ORIENTATION=+
MVSSSLHQTQTSLLYLIVIVSIDFILAREYRFGKPPIVLVEKEGGREYVELKNDIVSGAPPHDGITHTLSTTQIFVGISSLRDDRCGRTLHSLMSKAEHPERVFFGITQQNDDETIDCVEGYCALSQNKSIEQKPDGSGDEAQLAKKCKHYSNIKTIRIPHSEAKGPNLARGLQITMIDGQDFCLQVDAHSFGSQNWDTRLLQEWGKADNEMAVLTTYIGSPENLDKNVGGTHEVPHLCTAHLHGDFPFNDRASAARYLENPILCALWAAGFSFSKCHAELRVPYDINLIQIWTGEEFGRGARLWTSGYDFYTPTQPLIAHDYTPGKNQKKWNHNSDEFSKSRARLQTILRQDGSDQSEAAFADIEKKYDIGDKRTLQQYAEFCGIDIMHRTELFSWCQDYAWVPYEWTEEEIVEIRRFGNPNHYRLQQQSTEKRENERGAGEYRFQGAYVNDDFYHEIVGEIEHFQHSSLLGKLMHITVFVAFLTCFAW